MMSKDREYRAFDFTADEMIVEGKAVSFDQPEVMYVVDGIEFREKVSARAFDQAKMDDVVLNIDHSGKPAAKTKNGTLELRKTPEGLFVRADLSKNVTGRELYEDIKNGFYDKMSFAFTVRKDSYDKQTRTRTIEEIDTLYDVSSVTHPAYEATNISARSFFETEVELERKALAEAREREERMAKLKELLNEQKGDK